MARSPKSPRLRLKAAHERSAPPTDAAPSRDAANAPAHRKRGRDARRGYSSAAAATAAREPPPTMVRRDRDITRRPASAAAHEFRPAAADLRPQRPA